MTLAKSIQSTSLNGNGSLNSNFKTVGYITGSKRRKSKRNLSKSEFDKVEMLKSSAPPMRRVYGKSVGGGVLTFAEEQASSAVNQALSMCVVTASHEIESLETIWLGDEVAYSRDGSRPISTEIGSYQEKYTKDYLNIDAKEGEHTVLIKDPDFLWYVKYWSVSTKVSINYKYMEANGRLVSEPVSMVDYQIVNNIYVRASFTKPIPRQFVALSMWFDSFDFWSMNNPKSKNEIPQEFLKFATQWQDDMIGHGLHYVLFAIEFDKKVFSNGLPDFKFERKGAKIYDPRLDSTRHGNGKHRFDDPSTWEWSSNASLVILDLHTQVYSYTLDEIDELSFIKAANDCHGNFFLNGEFDLDEDYSDVVESMLEACAGVLTNNGGIIGLKVGSYQGKPTVTLDDSMLIGDLQIQSETPYKDRINTINVKYKEPKLDYEDCEADPVYDDDLILSDGRRLEERLDLTDWVSGKFQAEYLAWIMLRRSRATTNITAPCNLEMMDNLTGNTIKLDFKTIGIEGEFLCEEIDYSISNGVNLKLIRDDESFYDRNFVYNPPSQDLINRDYIAIPTPQNLRFKTAEDEHNQGTITWDNIELYTYRVEIISEGGELISTYEVSDPIVQLIGLEFAKHYVAVYCLTSLKRSGSAATLNFMPSKPPQSLFTWFVYADDDKGTNITTDPKDKQWLGIAENMKEQTPDLSDPSLYKWTNVKGDKGDKGEPGHGGGEGKDAPVIEYWYKEGLTATEVGTPTEYPPFRELWQRNPIPDDILKNYLYRTSIKIDIDTDLPFDPTDWLTPIRMTGHEGTDGQPGEDGKNGTNGKDGQPGEDGKNGTNGKDGQPGADGKPGTDGQRGTINIVDPILNMTKKWNPLTAWQAVVNSKVTNPNTPINWDVVTQHDDKSWSETRRYIDGSLANSNWEKIEAVIDGALIVNGSIKGDSFRSDTRMIAGTGSNAVVISGVPTDPYALWAGDEKISAVDSKFKVTPQGVVTMIEAIIKGSSQFGGNITMLGDGTLESQSKLGDRNWKIGGNGEASFTGVKINGTLVSADGEFTGTLKGVDGTFLGTVYADNIEGDVMKYVESNPITSFRHTTSAGNNPDKFELLESTIVKDNSTVKVTDSYLIVDAEPRFDRRAICMTPMKMMVDTGEYFNPANCDISITAELIEVRNGAWQPNSMMRFKWTNAPWTIVRAMDKNGVSSLDQMSRQKSYYVELTPANDGKIFKSSQGRYGLRVRVASYQRTQVTINRVEVEVSTPITGVSVYQVGSDESTIQVLLEKRN